ncbi:MAG: hypothetical protein KAS66_07540 [Candidatus Omnitrophica bacterium]|nr:hypothetical protein [Candidatus Omnitrophota bacterium]
MITEITWTKAGIMDWMVSNKVLEPKTASAMKKLEDRFIVEANKHQDTSEDRKLYRVAKKLIESGKVDSKAYQKFMEL